MNNKEISIYIHFPWCLSKCFYCDFNSYKIPSLESLPEREYTAALISDLTQDLNKFQPTKLKSIYFGGGTPSLFSAFSIENILTTIDNILPVDAATEISLEANPVSIENKYISDYKHAGITRLSIGVQSFQDQKLFSLGRAHTAQEAKIFLEKVIATNFTSFNIDLIYNLPQQNAEDAVFDLTTGINFNPKHISWYELTIEPNTVFGKQNPTLPSEETSELIQQQGLATLNAAGFYQYEISAFAKTEHKCQHNLNYWQFGDYIGVGAGAHSKITIEPNKILRISKHKAPTRYLNCDNNFIDIEENVHTKDLPFEFMLNALRLNNGFHKNLFQERTGLPLSTIDFNLLHAKNLNLLEITDDYIIPTDKGKTYLNDLTQLFME